MRTSRDDWREIASILRGYEQRIGRLEEEREPEGTVNKVLDPIDESAVARDSVSTTEDTDPYLVWDSGDKWGQFTWK